MTRQAFAPRHLAAARGAAAVCAVGSADAATSVFAPAVEPLASYVPTNDGPDGLRVVFGLPAGIDNLRWPVAAVPEPPSALVLGAGLAAPAAWRSQPASVRAGRGAV